MATRLITVNDILAGHVSLDVACLDRIYLNGLLAHGAGARAGRAVLAAPRIPDPVSGGGGEDGPTRNSEDPILRGQPGPATHEQRRVRPARRAAAEEA